MTALEMRPSTGLWRLSHNNTVYRVVAAASLVAGSIIPKEFLIYTGLSLKDIIEALRLKPDTDGSIMVMSKFWFNEPEFTVTTHPLLIYADLMQTHVTRNHEIAATIFQEHISKLME